MNRFLLILFFSGFSLVAFAASVKGRVNDNASGEPLVGATVYLKNTSFGTSVSLDGSFLIKGIPSGTYTLIVSMVGYRQIEKQIEINEGKDLSMSFEMAEDSNQLNEIVVTGVAESESDLSVRRAEQKADNVVNIMSAKSIQLLPDLTVGNLLQRVSGVSIVRNGSGDGQYAIIRGMDKRYNYTMVNGIKIPSPDNKNRYVPLDIFPSDLLERLEVIKALTPNMEGDAIGGAMNMVLKSAPSQLSISATAATGYSNIFNGDRPFSGFSTSNLPAKSPEELYGPNYQSKVTDFGVNQLQYSNRSTPLNTFFNLSIGNQLFNNKLGFVVAGSYQNIFRGTNSIFYKPGEPAALPAPNTYQFAEVQFRQFSNLQNRLGLMGRLDYAISKAHKLSLTTFFMQLNEAQHRNYYNPLGTGAGLATNDVRDRSRFTTQRIYNATLKGDHQLSNRLKMDWTIAYSLATSNTPAWSDMNVRNRYNNQVLVSRELLPVTQQWTYNNDKDFSGYLNFTHAIIKNLDISVGGMARFKNRDNVYTQYELGTLLTDGTGNYQAFSSIDKAVFNFLPATNAYANLNDPNNYTAKENVFAGYVQGKYNLNTRLQIVGGVRFENTNQEYRSQLTPLKEGRDGQIVYSDILPSIHFKYALFERQNIRLSYYKALSRQNYFEFVPTEISGDIFTEAGNYKIRHTSADNYDLRYEFFDKGSDQILAGVFYKNITDPIEYGFLPTTVSSANVVPFNYAPASNYGFELVVIKYIKNFGVSANYTYTSSTITTSKILEYQATLPDNSTTIRKDPVNQTRPLQGQSDHIANVSFLYKNPKNGFDAQLSWVYTGRRINLVSPYKDLDYWQRGFSQFDFSAEKKIFKRFQVFVKITNLLDTPLITEVLSPNYLNADAPAQDGKDRIVVQKDEFRQTFLAGLRFKL